MLFYAKITEWLDPLNVLLFPGRQFQMQLCIWPWFFFSHYLIFSYLMISDLRSVKNWSATTYVKSAEW